MIHPHCTATIAATVAAQLNVSLAEANRLIAATIFHPMQPTDTVHRRRETVRAFTTDLDALADEILQLDTIPATGRFWTKAQYSTRHALVAVFVYRTVGDGGWQWRPF